MSESKHAAGIDPVMGNAGTSRRAQSRPPETDAE